MDLLQLLFTHIVLERAKQLRKLDNPDDLSIEPPNLEPYVKQAVQQLKAWHPIVMKEVLQHPNADE